MFNWVVPVPVPKLPLLGTHRTVYFGIYWCKTDHIIIGGHFCTYLLFCCSNWYPFTVVIFYLLSPIPSIIARRYTDTSGENGQCKEIAWFLTTGTVSVPVG